MTNDMLTTKEVREMVRVWLTGDDERDARSLSRAFRGVRFTLAQWRQVVAETKATS